MRVLFLPGGSDQFDWDMERDLASRGGMRRGRKQAQQTEWDMTADAEELRKFQAEINAWSPEKLYGLYNEAGQEIDGDFLYALCQFGCCLLDPGLPAVKFPACLNLEGMLVIVLTAEWRVL